MITVNSSGDIGIKGRTMTAVGVFDGVHCAHRKIIKAAIAAARKSGGKAAVVTFWPHPRGRESLYSLEHRLRILEELGVDICLVVRFDKKFAGISPEDFVDRILCRGLHVSTVYVGENFRFGKGASAGAGDLSRLLAERGARVRVFRTLRTGGKAVSSSYIRTLIRRGELSAARRLLLRPVSVYGDVVKGTGKATGLGFPTANIDPHHEITPPAGIYAVKAVVSGRSFGGVCYIGTRPTFARSPKDRVIEVHVFGLRRDLYGEYIEAQFIKKIREQKKFTSEKALSLQISSDIQKAKKILSLSLAR